jgi:preprotein translocase subunit SecD
VLDKTVISAPQIQGVLTGTSQITGQFTAVSAKQLADQLNFGALPVTFTSGPAQTVSATLGIQQLKAGLLAAAIGMLLVAVYAFFYYRLLGSVIFLSLMLSGLLTFGALVFLGRTVGFTLTLAGIAGFIVSLGCGGGLVRHLLRTPQDEIHEGRSPRSAVPRAGPGPGARSSRRTRSRSWPRWCSTSSRSARFRASRSRWVCPPCST